MVPGTLSCMFFFFFFKMSPTKLYNMQLSK